MSPDRESSAVPLFGSNTDHFLIPAKACSAISRTAVAGGGGQQLATDLIPRPLGLRASATRLTARARWQPCVPFGLLCVSCHPCMLVVMER